MAISKDFIVKNGIVVLGKDSVQTTSTTTGALVVKGGVGIGGNLWVGGSTSTFSGNVGIGSLTPVNKLTVIGDIGLDGISVRDTAITTTTSVSRVTLFQYPTATYGSCDVVIQATSNGQRHLTKLLVSSNTTTAIATEYGELATGSLLFTTQVDTSGTNTRVLITPNTTTSITFKTSYELITA